MTDTPCKRPCLFCFGCLCGCCMVYNQRELILDVTGEPYKCFGGRCCGFDTPEMPKVPCLCCESFCCTGNAIITNRYMVRDMYALELDPCDEYLIMAAVVVSWLVCILKIFGVIEEDSICDDLAECFIMIVLGCSL
eukprot:UN28236